MPINKMTGENSTNRQDPEHAKASNIGCETPYRQIINSMQYGYAYCKMIIDNGHDADFMYEEVNESYEKLTGLTNLIGRTLTEALQGITRSFPELLENYVRVADTGFPEHFEFYMDGLGKWYDISLYRPQKSYVVSMFDDITQRKESEEALKQSEDRFRQLFEGHSVIMLVIDESGNIINANPAASAFYGYPIEELSLMHLEQITTKPSEAVKRDLETFRRTKLNRFSILHRTADGTLKDVEVVSNTIDIQGKVVFYCIINDISDRRQAEEALRKSERNFRAITEQMAEVVIVVDSNGTVTYASPASEKMFEYLPDELIGHPFTAYLPQEEIADALEIFNNIIRNQESNHVFEFRFRKKTGERVYGEVHVHYYHDEELHGMIGLIRDITESKQHEINRIQHEQQLLESRQFLQSIYDEVNHSIFVVEVLPDGTYRFKGHNPLHEKLTGIPQDEIAGKTPHDLLDPETAKAVTTNFDICIRENRSIQYEESLLFQGKQSWWETVLNPVRSESGTIYRIIGTSTNITQRKLAEKQLKKLSVTVEQSPAIVVITDPEGNIEYVNPMFTHVTGYSAKEVTGQNPRILQSGLMPKKVYEELWNSIISGQVWCGELQNKKKNGELYWDQAVISAIMNKDGEITNFVAVKLDITEQKRVVNELLQAKQKAEESDRLKSAFLANISHEIRTPMNGILGFSELLKDPHLTGEEQAEYIDLIQQSGERMLSLINNLINISRIEAGETMLHIAETPVNELLHDLYGFFKPEMNKKGLRLHCVTPLPDSDSIIETDSVKLAQIITNLIQNALKFTNKGEIDFGYNLINNILEFYVIDTGIGIPVEMKTKIFDRFHQVDNPLTRTQEGSGLGLSISKSYIEMLGGTIRMESEADWGSEFYFTLPYNPAGSSLTELPLPIMQKPVISFPASTILIVEDDTVSSLLLKKSLNRENITMLFAGNGKEAVEMVQQHHEINLVLMDIRMPLMDGYEATKAIKKIRRELPVIIQTAFTSKEERQKAEKAGCDGFLIKPIDKNELLKLVEKLVGR
jgi:PAS domain S-box-containing protein